MSAAAGAASTDAQQRKQANKTKATPSNAHTSPAAATPVTSTSAPSVAVPASSSSSSSSSSSAVAPSSSSTAPSHSSSSSSSSRPHRPRPANVVAVSASSKPAAKFWLDLSLRLFIQHEIIEVHGVGSSVQLAIHTAQTLVSTGKATTVRINTNSVGGGNGFSKKPEFIHVLKRTQIPVMPAPLTRDERALVQVCDDRPAGDSADSEAEQEEEKQTEEKE